MTVVSAWKIPVWKYKDDYYKTPTRISHLETLKLRQQPCHVSPCFVRGRSRRTAGRRHTIICKTNADDQLDNSSSNNIHDNLEQEESLMVPNGVTLKIALDSQGGIVDLNVDESVGRFTSPASLDMVHRLRCYSDAVLIGRGTVIADNPSLTIRRVTCNRREQSSSPFQPLRVVLDRKLSLLSSKKETTEYDLFCDGLAKTVIYYDSKQATTDSIKCLSFLTEEGSSSSSCVEGVPLVSNHPLNTNTTSSKTDEWLSAKQIVQDLQQRYQCKHLMVEGGAATARAFLRAGIVDRAIVVVAPTVTFREPLLFVGGNQQEIHDDGNDQKKTGITYQDLLKDGGLEYLGFWKPSLEKEENDGADDEIHCWSRPNIPWPMPKLHQWP